jgi:hypothetical protein
MTRLVTPTFEASGLLAGSLLFPVPGAAGSSTSTRWKRARHPPSIAKSRRLGELKPCPWRARAPCRSWSEGAALPFLAGYSVAVRPYLDDALHGTRVMLTPARYALRPGSASVSVSPEPGGWSLSTTERATFRIRYEVVDRATGEVVLREDTALSCGPDAPPVTAGRPRASPMEEQIAQVDEQLAQLEQEIAQREQQSTRLDREIERVSRAPPQPPPPQPPKGLATVTGALALSFLATTQVLMGVGTVLAATDRPSTGFFVTGGLSAAIGVAFGSVYLSQRIKTAALPSVSEATRPYAAGDAID